MKALALEDVDGHRAVLITSDFQGVPKLMSDPVFAQAREKFGLERRQLMFTFSHNHCGPRLGDDLIDYYPVDAEQEKLVDEYTSKMVIESVAMIGEALQNLAPAQLQTGMGHCTFAVNRRNNREADVPMLMEKGIALVGPVDHTVPVMTVTRPDGKLEAILFGYACHPTTLNFLTWCGEHFPDSLETRTGKAASGHHSDVCQHMWRRSESIAPAQSGTLRKVWPHARRGSGRSIEGAARSHLRRIENGTFEYVELPYLKVMSREELQAEQQEKNGVKVRWAERLIKKLDAGDKFETAYPYPIHTWRLGKRKCSSLAWGPREQSSITRCVSKVSLVKEPGSWVMPTT